ncbi:MAG: 4'-phosphopantetheinyl transferase superfamily protein [Deltaproteobacteria bacterium]|nr:4'-phosphopantetheinyl transferase superfamily protein [Deltaproteobacteria bacterium]
MGAKSDGERVWAGELPFRLTIARAAEHVCLARGESPPDFLSPREEELLARLRFPDRRRKWLLGRWAAKRLLREALREERGGELSNGQITVANDPMGAPYAEVESDGPPSRVPWTLSLSHRADVALAVLSRAPGVTMGADLELVQPRDPALVRDFFTDAEAAAVELAAGREADLVVARTWSAKEAVLKALALGLRLDTRRIEVRDLPADVPGGPSEAAASPSGDPRFHRIYVALDAPAEPALPDPTVVWRDDGAWVLTVAWLDPASPRG